MPKKESKPPLWARPVTLALRASVCALLVSFVACTRYEPPSKASPTSGAPLSSGADSNGVTAVASPTNSDPASPAQRAKPQSAEECRQSCNGEWSAHGISGVVSCLCRTTDSGRDCRDKSECQGECLLAPVRTEQVSAGPPATGYFVGKCAEFVTSFGCSRRIQAGAKSAGPVDLSEPPPEICQD